VLLGGNGQPFEGIIREINAFTQNNKELIILNLSCDVNRDDGYRPLNQAEWAQLLEQLTGEEGLNHLFVAPNPTSVDLTTLPLNQFIGTNQAAVLIIVHSNSYSVILGEHHHRGAYNYSQMNMICEHTQNLELDVMVNRQLQLMRNNRPSPDSPLFLLSWTHRDPGKVLFGSSVLELSEKTWSRIYTDLFPKCSKDTYPNILYLDGLVGNDITALAMAINHIAAVSESNGTNTGQFNPQSQTSIQDRRSGNSSSSTMFEYSNNTQPTQQGNDGMSLRSSIWS